MVEQNTHTYDASDIQVLEGLEPVRLRPGMYIGGTDEKAWHHLPVEILDNSIDEAVAGFAKKIIVNLIDSIANAASDGMKVSLNVIAMLIALLSLIAMADWCLAKIGLFLFDYCHIHLSFIDLSDLSIKSLLGAIFSLFAFIMGVPFENITQVGALMGEKLVLNEFIAYTDLIQMKECLTPKAITIASIALCGFANFGSIAIQIGGIGELAPTRRGDIAKLGIKALIAGTFASYISACMAGILM